MHLSFEDKNNLLFIDSAVTQYGQRNQFVIILIKKAMTCNLLPVNTVHERRHLNSGLNCTAVVYLHLILHSYITECVIFHYYIKSNSVIMCYLTEKFMFFGRKLAFENIRISFATKFIMTLIVQNFCLKILYIIEKLSNFKMSSSQALGR